MDRRTNPLAPNALTSALLAAAVVVAVATTSSAQMGGGHGQHGGQGTGDMGRGMGGVMLVSGGTPYRTDGTALRMDDAMAIATRYLGSQSSDGLALDEIEEWDYNFYVVVKETAPPQYKAYQLLVDKWTGAVMQEPGPGMMWNRKYVGRRGMMRDHGQPDQWTQPMPVNEAAATAGAIEFLRQRFPANPNADVGSIDTFYGYYTLDIIDTASGAKLGMLSVHGWTGQVWYHTWHGAFIQGREAP